jgi:UDP-4-amino-4,6-dideoxy-N-acetyl-beta-L-altrosamine transaminase
MKKIIPYSKQKINEEDISAVVDSLRSDYLTTGPRVEEFEEALAKKLGVKYAISCSNATAGLHLSCLALNLGKSSQGLTSPITFVASANCLEYTGAQTDFIDIEDETLCLDPQKLEERCKRSRVDVVIPVSFAGIACKLSDIAFLANKYGFKIIEDAAHSLGTTYQVSEDEFYSGGCAHSDLAVVSFHPVKNITTGEGGAVLTNSSDLAARVKCLRSHGMKRFSPDHEEPWGYEVVTLGLNYRLTDIQSALGLSQLQKLDYFGTLRRERFSLYQELLTTLSEQLILPATVKDQRPVYHLYTLRFREGRARRKFVYEYLRKEGVLTQVHYIPVHLQPYYVNKYGYSTGLCPIAENYYNQCLSLPLYPDLSLQEQKYVVELVKQACAQTL